MRQFFSGPEGNPCGIVLPKHAIASRLEAIASSLEAIHHGLGGLRAPCKTRPVLQNEPPLLFSSFSCSAATPFFVRWPTRPRFVSATSAPCVEAMKKLKPARHLRATLNSKRVVFGWPWGGCCPQRGWRKYRLEAIATRLEAIASRLEAIATRVEAIASRLEAIATRVEAIATSGFCPGTGEEQNDGKFLPCRSRSSFNSRIQNHDFHGL